MKITQIDLIGHTLLTTPALLQSLVSLLNSLLNPKVTFSREDKHRIMLMYI